MTVTAQIIDVQVNAEAQSAAVSVSVQIGQEQQLTKENIDAAIGASEAGDPNKFYNEQGDWVEVESGQAEAEFQISVTKADCEFKGDWIKIAHSEATNNKRIIVRRATIEDSNGEQELDLMIAYPAAETYIGTDIYRGFYIQDRHGLLSQTADWDILNFEYDIEADNETKYSFLNHETGINVISDHRRDGNPDNGNEMHAMSMRVMFTSVFPEFKGDYIDTYIDPVANYSSIATAFEPTYYEKNRASIMMRPYSDAAFWENYSATADFIEIGSHGYNKDKRVNLTPSADVFLSHSVAVGAKKENDWQTPPQTTFGYGMEFFEITSIEFLKNAYTERGLRIYPHMALQLWSNADRTVVWTEYAPHQTYINKNPDCFKIGDIVFINVPLQAPTFGGTHWAEWTFWYNPASLKRTIINIQTVDGVTYMTLDGAIWDTQLNGDKYLWAFTPAAYVSGNKDGSTQSPATMIVGAKFAKIKQETGLGLRLIREACRQTAVLANGTTTTAQSYSGATTTIEVASTTEFPDEGIISISGQNFVYTSKTATSFIGLSQVIDCSNGATVSLKWDVWRGFGQIDVQAAIAFLQANYINDDDYKATVQRSKVNPVLDYVDLGENDSVAKRMVEDLLSEKQDNILFVEETENKFLRDDNTFQTIDLSGKENTSNKQNSLTADGTGTKFPTVDAVNAGLVANSNLLYQYIHSGNIEVYISAIDYVTHTFTSVGHGLANGDQLNIKIIGEGIIEQIIPFSANPIATNTIVYYVINKSTDTFQISQTNGGEAVPTINKATQNFSLWRFEKTISTNVNFLNLPSIGCDIEMLGDLGQIQRQIHINGSYLTAKGYVQDMTTYQTATQVIAGRFMYLRGRYNINVRRYGNITYIYRKAVGINLEPTNSTKIKWVTSDVLTINTYPVEALTSITLAEIRITNGTIINVYKI